MILGTISGYTAGAGVALTIDGESTPTTKNYLFLASYSPAVNDRVLIEEISGTYVVIGKVVSTPGRVEVATLAHRVRQYSNTSDYVEFTYFNDNLWAKINGGSQFAIAKK